MTFIIVLKFPLPGFGPGKRLDGVGEIQCFGYIIFNIEESERVELCLGHV
jgi:hypothetical protein